jgi:hypothetical protein
MTFGIDYTPAPMSADFVRAQLAALAVRTGILHADKAEWTIELIIEADKTGLLAYRAILPDLRLSETLTALGSTDPGLAVAAIAMCASNARGRQHDLAESRKMGPLARLSAVHDTQTCESARVLSNTRLAFGPGEEPRLPLPDCDAWNCRCTFAALFAKSD